jgi:hypothetical protein
MNVPACAVGRLDPDGPWIGFAPSLDDGYQLTVGSDGGSGGPHRVAAEPHDLIALAILYFEDAFAEPPEELAATLGDIGAVVRHAAERITDAPSRRAFDEAVDAIDDGLAADVVLDRLARAFGDGPDAATHLRGRVAVLTG